MQLPILCVGVLLGLSQLGFAFRGQNFYFPASQFVDKSFRGQQANSMQKLQHRPRTSNISPFPVAKMSTFDEPLLNMESHSVAITTPAFVGETKKAPFSRQEDIFICGKVLEWGDKGEGLWETLQEEMGREQSSIEARWKHLAGQRIFLDVEWNEELDNKLAEVVTRLPQPTKWVEVGKEMELKTQQCRSRWLTHHLPLQQGRNVGEWTDEETARLTELVEGLELGQPINWPPIADQLQRAPLSCARKWKEIMRDRIRHSQFSPREDAMLWQCIQKVGDRALRAFEKLQTVFGRHAHQLRMRYYGRLLNSPLNQETFPKDVPKKINNRHKKINRQ